MEKDLYLMRHGKTRFNQLHKIQGACDSPLTEQGIEDVKKVRQYFIEHNLQFDQAYCSTQERASDTIEIVSDMPYKRLKGLKEWDFGMFEGESETLNPPQNPDRHSYGDFFADFGGESDLQVQERMNQTLTQIMQQKDHQRVLVVSHGGACFMFMQSFMSYPEIKPYLPLPNCCILHFKFEDDKFRFVEEIDAVSDK